MLQQNALLIELGSAQVKIAVAGFRGGVVHVQDAFLVDLPADTYKDGKILEAEVMRTRIQNALHEHQIKVKETYLTLNGTNIITREISLPDVADHELADMLQYEIQQYMPIDLEQYILEHKVLERFNEDAQRKVRVLVVAISKQEVDEYYKFLLSLNLKPLVMDINGNSVSKLFSPRVRVNDQENIGDQTVAVIDMGQTAMAVSVIQNGVLKMNRLVEWEGVDQEQLKEGQQVFDSMVASWATRIQRVFQFYGSRGSANHIDQLYLYGGIASLAGVPEKLHSIFNIPVCTINTLSSVQLSSKSKTVDLKRYLNTFGTIARDK